MDLKCHEFARDNRVSAAKTTHLKETETIEKNIQLRFIFGKYLPANAYQNPHPGSLGYQDSSRHGIDIIKSPRHQQAWH